MLSSAFISICSHIYLINNINITLYCQLFHTDIQIKHSDSSAYPMIQQRIIKTDQTGQSSSANQQNSQIVVVSNQLSPDIFLFQQIVIDILNYCKRNLKVQPFDDMQVDKLVQGNKSQSIDIYQQYFLLGIGSLKTRDYVCNKYEQLVRDNLINKENLPTHMITGVINARSVGPSGGGSTASSGSNSIVGSATNINIQKSISIAKLISTIICSTIQPSSQISAGLIYILEATRNKNNGASFVQVMEDLYSNLSKFRKKPIDRFIMHFVNRLVSEVEYHESSYIQYEQKYLSQQKKYKNKQNQASYRKVPSIMRQDSNQAVKIPDPPPMFEFIRKQINPNSKQALCVHARDEDAKFGKCFICDRGANNYDKALFVPLCSMQCKNKLKRINQQCIMNDHFSFLKWILETLRFTKPTSGNGDEILYSLLLREVVETQKLSQQQIGTLMEIIVNNFSLQAIGITSIQSQLPNVIIGSKIIQNSALIMSHLVRKYPSAMFSKVNNNQENIMRQINQAQEQIENKKPLTRPNFNNTKIIITQIVRLLQTLPVQGLSLQLNLLKSLIQILSSKQYVSQSKSFSYIVLRQLYIKCDCKILQTNLVERIFNIISQYALQGTSVNPSSKQPPYPQNVGTSSSISIQSSNAISLGMINNVNMGGSSCPQTAIFGLEQLLLSLVQTMNYFNELDGNQAADAIKQKKIKKYIQTKFVQQFNKKPIKTVDKLRKLFNNKITAKDIAILLRQNMDYEYEIKVKKFRQYINKQQVGTYFGTLKKNSQNFNQKVYWQFLQLLKNQYQGKEIDDCLRITFNAFNMPKEGQQVQVVLGPLSLVLEPFLGLKEGGQATATYQLIMVTLMVQTSNKPNVKEGQKLKLDGFKKFCYQFDQNLSEARITQIYNRMKQRPLQILMEYRSNEVFTKKHLRQEQLQTDFWRALDDITILQQKSDSKTSNQQSIIKKDSEIMIQNSQINQNKKKQQIRQQIIQSKSSLQLQQSRVFQNSINFKTQQNVLSFTMLNLWQYVYMSFVNKNNLRGLQHACILYGKCQLLTQFQAFFNHLYKLHQDLVQKPSSAFQAISNQAKLIILKLAIDQSNYVIGRQAWLIIIKIIYKLDTQQDQNIKPVPKKPENSYSYYQYEASDKLFTRTNTFKSERLKQFLEAMCQFSSSQVKTDKNYTRQMYILHHITQIIEYNLQKFKGQGQDEKSLWNVIWPTIRSYFRNICIHPRKQISMSAIDSYKQLTMKMLKLDSSQINHTQLMNLYLYVFERSPAYIKDLIINILLNVVCREMKTGWNELYTILQISDSEDKNVVMKVVTRLIKDIGMGNIGNLLRLHQIIIKQLRICNQEAYRQTMNRLWQVCECFNRLDIWLQTLSKMKDIYKSTSNVEILTFLYKVCNKCIQMTHKENKKEENQQNKINQSQIIQQNQQKLRQMQYRIEEKFMSQAYQSQIMPKQSNSAPFQVDQVYRLVYFQVFSVQMHILEIKSTKLFVESINSFKELDMDVFFKYMGNGGVGNSQDNKTGFLALWEMFLSSNHAVNFSFFLHEYLTIVFVNLSKIQRQFSQKKQLQKKVIKTFDQLNNIKRQIFLWLMRIFLQTSKDEIIQLCQQDSDLSKSFSQIIQTQSFSSSKTQLIQFYLSSKQYEARSIQHLVFLKIFKSAYESGIIGGKKDKDNSYNNSALEDLSKRILEGIVQSYQTASQVNDKPLLRNFLWNNEFFKGQDYLPGLMKQQLRSFELIVKFFDLKQMQGKICKLILNFIRKFSYKASLIWKKYNKQSIKQTKKKDQKPSIQIIKPEQIQQNQTIDRLTQILYQDLGLWVTNSQQITAITLRKLATQIKNQQKQNKVRSQYFQYQKLFDMCMELSKFAVSPLVLKETSGVLEELIIKMF